jgi:hypothetical protein
MNAAPPPLQRCSVCQTVLDPNGTCPRCRAPEDWGDQIEAVDFVLRRLTEWHTNRQLTDKQLQSFADLYNKRKQSMSFAAVNKQAFEPDATYARRDECWSCKEYLYTNASHCASCGAPISDPGVRSLRYLNYLCRELEQHEESGLLNLRQAHEFTSDIKERIAALQRKLERERAPFVLPVEDEPRPRKRRRRFEEDEEPTEETEPRRTFLEVLLDPHSIQWLLAAGGGLIVLGLVIWLSSLGLFENSGFVAVLLGIGNALLIAGGWALILRTRYENAGRALTLLACLVMPLNLWFYHTHGLVTLENHLWVAALFCCIIYTASAYVLKDSLFVYVLVAGVTLTGLLLLAQMHRFGEVIAPVTLLIVIGLICLHAERAFPDIESPFSRRHFGMAFYWSSVILFAFGMLLLLASQTIGWAHRQIFPRDVPFDVVRTENLPWTLALVLAGTYAYIYSDLVVRRIGVYLYFAGIAILWAEIHVLVLADLTKVEAVVIITLALTALVINVLQVTFESQHDFLRRVSPLGIVLSVLPVGFGVLLHFRATNNVLNHFVPFEITWAHVSAMAVTALCCRAGAYLYRHRLREVSVLYFFLTALATLVFAAGLAWMIGVKAWESQAPLVMIVPILYLFASYLYRGHTPENPLIWAAHGAVGLLLFFSLWVALGIVPQVRGIDLVQGKNLNLLLALFCLEAAFFYGVAAFLRRTNWTIYLATVMLCGAIWQFLKYFNTPDELYTVAFALPGFALLVAYRLGVFEKWEIAGLERATFQSANALTTLGFVSGALLSLSRVFLSEHQLAQMDAVRREVAVGDWHNPIFILLYLLIALTIISLLSAWLVQHPVWRRVYLVLSIVNGILLALIIHRLVMHTLTAWQWLEIFSIVVGLILLGIGYVGWYRETERASDLISFALFLGAACLVFPMLLAIVSYRLDRANPERYRPGPDDIGLVAACVLLFGSGILCRIKATTLIGSLGMFCYLVVIVIGVFRHLNDAWMIGVLLTLGGASLFGTGLFLSMYRDRLLALPDKIKRREGIFRIFDWR